MPNGLGPLLCVLITILDTTVFPVSYTTTGTADFSVLLLSEVKIRYQFTWLVAHVTVSMFF